MQEIEDWLTEHGFSGFVFKIFAIISMCIDHIGAVMFPEWTWMRIIGRFAFPIFCFFLAEGAYYTSNIRKYEMRLLLFAILSEVPFDLAFYRQPVYWYHQNVFFTLFFGLLTLDLLMHLKNYLLRVGSFVGIGLLCEAIHTDYGIVGILFIVLFFVLREDKRMAKGSVLLMNFAMYFKQVQMFASLACVLLFAYNGKRGPSMRWFFYLFYPLHLLILGVLAYMGVV